MTRSVAVENLFEAVAAFARRSRDLHAELHPNLSLVAYTLLSRIQEHPKTRAADLAAAFGLDKSTVSRQVEQLTAQGLLRRGPERAGRRGQELEVTSAGDELLAAAAGSAHDVLVGLLRDWNEVDIAQLAALLGRFNGCVVAPISTPA